MIQGHFSKFFNNLNSLIVQSAVQYADYISAVR